MKTMDIRQLESLLADHDFKSELKAYRAAYQRLKVRLRNNPFTAQLKQLANMTKLLEASYSVDLLKTYNRKISEPEQDIKKKRHYVKSYLKFLNQMITQLDKLIEKTLHNYAQTQPRLRVGHLVHHYIVVKACVARIRICFKALLIYSCDLYIDICKQYKYKGQALPNCNDIHQILLKNNCKLRIERSEVIVEPAPEADGPEGDQKDVDQSKGQSTAGGQRKRKRQGQEEIGQLIDRKTMKPIVERRKLRPRPGNKTR